MTHFNKKFTINSFIKGQFSYCSLLWMFSTRAANQKINRLHERRALLNHETSTFNNMLSKSNDTTIHVKKYSKILDSILQISLRFFGYHNERRIHKNTP